MMDPVKKATWVAALRSGKYQQIRRVLYGELIGEERGVYGYCCLGVALEVCEGWTPNRDSTNGYAFVECALTDWKRLFYQAGVFVTDITTLAQMNDAGRTFDEIAAWIEEHL